MTTIIPQIFTNLTYYKPARTSFYTTKPRKPANSFTIKHVCFYHRLGIRLGFESSGKLLPEKDQFDEKIKKKKRVVLVRFNNLNFPGGGGGGGGGRKDDGGASRVLGNLLLAIGLTYLSLTGQLGWILDAIVSFWLLVVIVPVVGFGALIWWASCDMVEIKCRNCGTEFEVFKSMLNDEPQVCPYCSQPFSVVGDEFVRDPSKFGKQSTTFGETFSDLFSQSKKGKSSSKAVIDVEAEVKDIE